MTGQSVTPWMCTNKTLTKTCRCIRKKDNHDEIVARNALGRGTSKYADFSFGES